MQAKKRNLSNGNENLTYMYVLLYYTVVAYNILVSWFFASQQ